MLLAMDVGNTQTVIGLFDGEAQVAHWRVSTRVERTADEWAVLLAGLFEGRPPHDPNRVDGAILSSVVPSATDTLMRMMRDTFKVRCKIVGPGLKTGMPILFDDPREVGADRIVNAVAAYARWPRGLILVDFGTATTFDVVSPKPEYLGGVIAPGIGIAADALFARAAKLPRVDISRPERVVGRNTVGAIQSGLVYGYIGLVEGLIGRIREEVAWPCRVVATGGFAPVVADRSSAIDVVDDALVLEGLRLIHLRNAPTRAR